MVHFGNGKALPKGIGRIRLVDEGLPEEDVRPSLGEAVFLADRTSLAAAAAVRPPRGPS